MSNERLQDPHGSAPSPSVVPSGSAEFIATVTVLAFVALTAASLFLSTPQNSEASATAKPMIERPIAGEPAERPFHERYSVQPSGAAIDPPTF